MSSLRIYLFGAPRVERNGAALALRRTKALALLAYLAVTQRPQHRDAVTALLWPEFDDASARNNLRREMSLLRAALGETVLLADRMQLTLDGRAQHWVDVVEFTALLDGVRRHDHPPSELCDGCTEALSAAVRLHSDDFLAGFSLPSSPQFDEWQYFAREELRQQLAGALEALIARHSNRREYEAALLYARRWLQLDVLHEPAHRELMRLYAWTGQQAAALRQYEECARVLNDELGADPEPETEALHRAIKARRLEAPAPPPRVTPPVTAPGVEARADHQPAPVPARLANNLPAPTSSFVGRRRELMDVVRRCTDPECRLLTLTGPGGIGKTQLALQAAHTIADGWAGEDEIADGVLFVPLAAVTTPDGFHSALASAAGFNFYPGVPSSQQVLDFFRARRMLVVLDNFEQLLDAVDFVAELLEVAPRLRLLVTSRAALNLHQEWFHPVEGLSYPGPDDTTDDLLALAQFDAVRLFDQHARRARSDFNLGASREAVVSLSRFVEGMPLAIELAAAWLKVLSADQVVAALEQGLDILTARDRNIPQRHRNMRAVLEESWHLLPEHAQGVLTGLSVFSGGFTAAAAEAVVGATLDALATLVERSMIRYDADGRYQMHELLRQYGSERRRLHVDLAGAAERAHSAYFIDYLARRRAAISGDDQTAAVAEVLAEHDNVRGAWQWATTQRDFAAIGRAGHVLAVFYEFRGRYREGVAMLQPAIAGLRSEAAGPERDLVYAARLIDLGWLQIRLGELAGAAAAFRESYELWEAHGTVPLPSQASDPTLGLGMVALLEGQYAEAARLGGLALERSDERRASNRPRALFLLAKAAHAQGEYHAARRYAEQALAAASDHGHRWLAASMHNELGNTLYALGEYAEATHHYRTYYALREAFDDQRGMATALHGLGRIALREGRYADARAMFERSLAILRQVDAQVDIGLTLDRLAAVAAAAGDYAEARRCLAEALQLALASASQPLLLTVLTGAAQLLLPTEHAAWGAEALVLVLQHPANDHELSERANLLLQQYEREMAGELFAAAVQRGQRGSLGQFVPQLQAILAGGTDFVRTIKSCAV